MDDMFTLKDYKSSPDIVHEYSQEGQVPIVIDNGSNRCRVGWASSHSPELDFKNVMAKNRANRKERDWDIQVGNDISDIEAVRWMVRSPYDFNVVVNFSAQEILFDYAFTHLGINTSDSIQHPVVLTEPIANPSYCQKNMMELLFEAYSLPSIALGIDCLFSYYQNHSENINTATGLIISCGFQTTHVLPVIEGKPDIKNSLRLNLGGYNCSAYLQWLLQYRHHQYAGEFTMSRMETLVHQLGEVAFDYDKLVNTWTDPQTVEQQLTNIKFTPRAVNTTLKPSYVQERLLALEKKLKQAEYKLYEVDCILEIEQEYPEGASKASLDIGCNSFSEVKLLAEKLQSNINEIQAELDEEYKLKSVQVVKKNTFKLGIEKFQAPEIIFQPSLVGYDQCGLNECIETALRLYSNPVQNQLANNVFVTGGNSKIKGLLQRVSRHLREIQPFSSQVSVTQACDPSLDAWRGAAKWAGNELNKPYFISKNDYEEFGPQYFKEHLFSNRWVDPNLNANSSSIV